MRKKLNRKKLEILAKLKTERRKNYVNGVYCLLNNNLKSNKTEKNIAIKLTVDSTVIDDMQI